LLQFGGNGLRDGSAIFTDQHEHSAKHDFTTVFGSGPRAQLTADINCCHILDADRRAIDVGHHDVGNVVGGCHLPGSTNQELFTTAFNVSGTDVGIIPFQRRHKISQSQLVRRQAFWIGSNLIFFGETTNGVDFGDAGNVAQLRFDNPILDHPQVGRGVRAAVLFNGAFFCLDCPEENLTQAGRDRPHDRFHALG